jgi:hypothetical protein
MLFEGWPAARLPPAPGRVLTLALTALVALALDRALAAYAGGVRWTRATPNEWLTTAALSFIGAGIILHVGIGLRWPFARKTMTGAGAGELPAAGRSPRSRRPVPPAALPGPCGLGPRCRVRPGGPLVAHQLADDQAVLVVGETGGEKSSMDAAGAPRQYSGALGGIGLCQVAVHLT